MSSCVRSAVMLKFTREIHGSTFHKQIRTADDRDKVEKAVDETCQQINADASLSEQDAKAAKWTVPAREGYVQRAVQLHFCSGCFDTAQRLVL